MFYPNIHNIKQYTTHALLCVDTFPCCPLKASDTGVLNLVQILNTFRGVDKKIGTGAIRTETPDLALCAHVPIVLIREDPNTLPRAAVRTNPTAFNVSHELFVDWLSRDPEAIVPVLGFGQRHFTGLCFHGLAIFHKRVTNLEQSIFTYVAKVLISCQKGFARMKNNVPSFYTRLKLTWAHSSYDMLA